MLGLFETDCRVNVWLPKMIAAVLVSTFVGTGTSVASKRALTTPRQRIGTATTTWFGQSGSRQAG
jgi:hypothetical protein